MAIEQEFKHSFLSFCACVCGLRSIVCKILNDLEQYVYFEKAGYGQLIQKQGY